MFCIRLRSILLGAILLGVGGHVLEIEGQTID